MRKTIRLTIDVEVIDQPDGNWKHTFEEIKDGITLYEDEVIDGFNVTTNIKGCTSNNDFFIKNYKLINAEIL